MSGVEAASADYGYPGPPKTLSLRAGSSVTKDETISPDFEDQTLNRGQTVENNNSLKLKLSLDRFFLNISADYSVHIAGEENPYYPQGFRPYELNWGHRNLLDRRLDYKFGRFPVIAGRTYGLVDGAEVEAHSPSRRLSLSLFGGRVPELLTMEIGEKLAVGAIGRAQAKNTWFDLNFHQVYNADQQIERQRVGFLAINQSVDRLELRTANEFDPLNNKFPKLSADADLQLSSRWTAGLGVERTDPTFLPGSFFNTFPHYPYYHYLARANYQSRVFDLGLTAGETRFEGDRVNDYGLEARYSGFSLGGTYSGGSEDPYLNYAEAHLGYRVTIKDRLRLEAGGGIFRYNSDEFEGAVAYQGRTAARWEFIEDFVADASLTMRRNVDGVSDPLFSVGVTYFGDWVWGGTAK